MWYVVAVVAGVVAGLFVMAIRVMWLPARCPHCGLGNPVRVFVAAHKHRDVEGPTVGDSGWEIPEDDPRTDVERKHDELRGVARWPT